jgi:hypothetical protein
MSITDPEKQAAALEQIEDAKALIAGKRGAGGTPGGIGTFFLGLALVVVGGYLVLNQVQVTSSNTFFGLWHGNRAAGFGLTMLPLLIGIGTLFFDGKSKVGWVLSIGGALTMLAAILTSLSIYWAPTSLFNTLIMFGLLAAGVGLVLRSLRPYPAEAQPDGRHA